MSRRPRVHQLLPTLSWGDAVSNHVRHLQTLLRARGFESEVYASKWDEACAGLARDVKTLRDGCDSETVLLVHHSFESGFIEQLRRSGARVFVMFHNITPAWHFERFDPGLAGACAAGRDELLQLAEFSEGAFAYSRFSAEELSAAGFVEPELFPFTVDWSAFDAPPDRAFASQFEDGATNVLFVGRAVANKRVEDVLRVFTAYQRLFDPGARLLVAGQFLHHSAYVSWLKDLRTALEPERVHFLGKVSQGQLSALFEVASVYLSMSRHEGFGVPLIEAMHRKVPVVAYGAAAVPETMGGAGLTLLNDDPVVAAEVLAVLQRNSEVRRRVLAAQAERLRDFEDAAVERALDEVLLPAITGPRRGSVSTSPVGAVVVCPQYDLDASSAAVARRIAAENAGARVLALATRARPEGNGPEIGREEGCVIERFTPEWPVVGTEVPRSSSLETAALRSTGPVFLVGTNETNQALSSRLGPRARTYHA